MLQFIINQTFTVKQNDVRNGADNRPVRLDMTTECRQKEEKEKSDDNEEKSALKHVNRTMLNHQINHRSESERIENRQLVGNVFKQIAPFET